jgi:hypothetical protein
MAFKRSKEVFNQFIKSERNSVMEKQHPYNNIIENKLQQLPGADAEQLWAGMHGILDKKMPQEKERPGIFGWLLTSKSLLLVSAIPVLTLCYFAFTHFSKDSVVTKQGSSNSISTKTTLTNAKENAVATERKETPNIVNSSAAQINNEEQSTNINSNALSQQNEKSAYTKSSAIVFGGKNNAKHNDVTEKESKEENKLSVKNQYNKGTLFSMNEDKPAESVITQNTNSFSAGSLGTTSIDFITGLTNNSTNFSLLADTTIPADRNGLRDLLLKEIDAATKAGKKIKVNSNDKGPYVGIMAGLDLSSVKFKSMKTGNNKGIIAGYAFNKRWSVETGLFWNKKRFFGNGSSFHPSGYTLPTGVEMLSVYGNNQMYEWPINIRFTILPKKHSLFVTAGLSSYYMKTESYEYEYQFNGQPGKSYSSYKNQTKDWFSVANFSLGYTHKLGSVGSVRVEPYIKLPIRDIGINNMPVISTGLNVGFTRQILK